MVETQTIEIRSAIRSDVDAVTQLVAGFRDFLQRSEPANDELRASVIKWLGSEDTEVSIALLNGVAVGYATTLYQYSLWANGINATISDLFVMESVRKSGAGRRLIEHALEVAARRGARAANLSTNEMNTASTRIYESLGFNSFSNLWQGRQVAYRKSIP
jgi:GNAT superfamily N-acetyltransferase